jgi:hypothetical protein
MIGMTNIPLTIAVLATRIGITPHALYLYVNERLLKTIRLGNTQVVLPDEADRFTAAYFRGDYDRRKGGSR